MNAILTNKRIKQIKDFLAIQKDSVIGSDGKADSYQLGMYNGLELALSAMQGREAVYFVVPETKTEE